MQLKGIPVLKAKKKKGCFLAFLSKQTIMFRLCAFLASVFLLFAFLFQLFVLIGGASNKDFLRSMYFNRFYNHAEDKIYDANLW